jgi:hypothetical protein
MGQQQLLLLVLATVIVGLATVAGIQAFDENRNQAAADALSQKASSLAADVKAIAEKPQQIGGVDKGSATTTEIAQRLGTAQEEVTVPTAGDGTCSVANVNSTDSNPSDFAVSIKCEGDGDYSSLAFYGVYNHDGKDGSGNGPEVYVETSDPLSN